VRLLTEHDHKAVLQDWLQGLNPELDDRIPIMLLRKGSIEDGGDVLVAARIFAAGG